MPDKTIITAAIVILALVGPSLASCRQQPRPYTDAEIQQLITISEYLYGSEAYWDGHRSFNNGNVPQAIEYFKKSARAGYAKAYLILGLFHREGVGVPKDFEKSRELLEEAANRCDLDAQRALLFEYMGGAHWQRDLVQAHKWTMILLSQDDLTPVFVIKYYIKKMTPSEIEEAMYLAQDWKQDHNSDHCIFSKPFVATKELQELPQKH